MLIGPLLLMAQTAALPPVTCDGPNAKPGPRYLCLALQRQREACVDQASDDARPFTLCLAETFGNDVEAELRTRLATVLQRAGRLHGGSGRDRLLADQRRWERRRARVCSAEFREAPAPEKARAGLSCDARLAVPRIEYLARAVTSGVAGRAGR